MTVYERQARSNGNDCKNSETDSAQEQTTCSKSTTTSITPPQHRRIRFEKYNNADSYYSKEVWAYYKAHGGQPKPSELTRVPATQWSVMIHDPGRWEGCEVHHFDSIEERNKFIEEYD